ncbi:hypothetical protein CUMW_227730 [Citrus unshiu]|nr:hypothetical protein CUMW_227730 [Citrus unshiu]
MKCDCQLEQFLLRNSFKHIARMRSPHIRPSKMLVSLFRNRTQCLVPSFKTMTTVAAAKTSKDDYFADVNHIANIVRHDIYPERTLNRLNLTLISELTIELMKPDSLSVFPQTLSLIIEEFGKHGLIDNAVEVFNKCTAFNCQQRMIRKGFVPDKRTHTILVNAWCSSGKMREAQEFLQELSDKGFNPPVRMVNKMIKQGSVPDLETFNSLIETICKSGELGLCADVNTNKISIPAVSKELGASLMMHFVSLIKTHPPNRPVYAMFTTMCGRGGRFVEAANYLWVGNDRNGVDSNFQSAFDFATDG